MILLQFQIIIIQWKLTQSNLS